jgi:hypothetical protein
MLAESGECWTDRDARHGAKSYEVNDADSTVSRSDVRVESEARPEERRPMLAGEESNSPGEKSNR